MAYDFKREEEVQEFVNNLGIEYRFGCYKEKKPAVCHLLGDYLEAIKKDYEKAAKVYKNNCEEYGHGKSCLKIGNYALIGKGHNEANATAALRYFERGCDLGDATSCMHAGLLLTKHSGEIKFDKQDVPKGFNYLKKSCDNNEAQACYYMSGMYISGVPRKMADFNPHRPEKNKNLDYLIKPDMKEAFRFSMKACELGNVFACANVSIMYKKGEGVEKSEEQSLKFKKIVESLQTSGETTKELKFQQGLD